MPPQRGSGGRFVKGGGSGGGGSGGTSGRIGGLVRQAGERIGRSVAGAGGKTGRPGLHIKRVGDWKQVRSMMGGMRGKLSVAIQRALLAEGQYLRGQMVKGFTSQAPGGRRFAPLSPTTLTLRNGGGFSGSKALIRTGTLRGSITVVQERGGVVFVGVHRNSGGSNGRSLVNIAKVHEYGATIRITPKMRFWLMARLREAAKLGFVLGGSSPSKKPGYIVIPPRPFVQPIFDVYVRAGRHHAQQRIMAHVAKGIGVYSGPTR